MLSDSGRLTGRIEAGDWAALMQRQSRQGQAGDAPGSHGNHAGQSITTRRVASICECCVRWRLSWFALRRDPEYRDQPTFELLFPIDNVVQMAAEWLTWGSQLDGPICCAAQNATLRMERFQSVLHRPPEDGVVT